MKLSEAIRLGSTLDVQGFGFDGGDGIAGTCAMAAAFAAVGKSKLGNFEKWAYRGSAWPFLDGAGICPECGGGELVGTIISAHLNDTHRWSRERIADWIDATYERPSERQVREIAILKAAKPGVCNLDLEDLEALTEVLHG